VVGLADEDLDDVIGTLLQRCGCRVPPPAETATMPPIRTVADLYSFKEQMKATAPTRYDDSAARLMGVSEESRVVGSLNAYPAVKGADGSRVIDVSPRCRGSLLCRPEWCPAHEDARLRPQGGMDLERSDRDRGRSQPKWAPTIGNLAAKTTSVGAIAARWTPWVGFRIARGAFPPCLTFAL
jgi:hypothetical protein